MDSTPRLAPSERRRRMALELIRYMLATMTPEERAALFSRRVA